MSASISPPVGQQSLPPAVLQAMAARMGGGVAPPSARPPMGGPPVVGGPPGAMPPGVMPPGAGGPPPGTPGAGGPPGMAAPQPGAPPGAQAGPPTVPPRLPPPGAQQAGQQGQVDPRLVQAANQLASKGRYGDSIIAHLTPGEVQIPPEILKNNPQLVAAIKTAFQRMGVDISQFTAGSPATTKNPFTGVEENSLFGALLPVVGAVIGSIIPGVGTAVGGALGGAAGGLAGAAIDHTGPLGMLAGAAGGGLGGYLGGSGGLSSLFDSAGTSATTGAADSAFASGPTVATGANAAAQNAVGNVEGNLPLFNAPNVGSGVSGSGIIAANAPANMIGTSPSLGSQLLTALKGPGLYAGTGASLASMFAPPADSSTTASTDINKPTTPPTINPNWGQVIGSNAQPYPTFAGYNPFTAATQSGYTFYPVQSPVA